MKSVERWSPKLKPGKQPGKDDIIECKEHLPLDRLACMVAIGVLILIGTGAILAISGARPKKNVPQKLDAGELKAQNMRQDAVDVGSEPANLNPPARSTSDYASSIPTQGVVLTGLPGSLYQTPPLARKPALRRFGTRTDATGHSRRQLSAGAQKSGSAPYSKNEWPKAFVRYLEAHRDYLRAIMRHGAATAPNPKSRHRGSDSVLASVQGLVQPLK
ncbi:MAG: hypothetical protein WB586_09210 [Chthoniobacterales bacterium]